MDILSLLGSVFAGGATGLLGVVAQRLFDHWKLKQENDRLALIHAQELAMKKEDREFMKEEWAQRAKVAQIEADAKVEMADAEAFGKSFGLEPTRYSEGMKPVAGGKWAKFFQNLGWLAMVLVDVTRGIVRPGLTIYLSWLTTEMYRSSQATLALINLNPAVHSAMLSTVHQQIIATVLYLFTTCVTWWFGTRNKQKPPKVG